MRESSFVWISIAALLLFACGGTTSQASDDAGGGGGGGGGIGSDGGVIPPSTAVASVTLSSCIPTTYTLPVTLGGSQTFDMSLDTGSASLGVASNSCSSCDQVSPRYTPGSTAQDQGQQATAQYDTGQWTGEIYQDSVTIASAPAIPVDLVAIQSQDQFFSPQQCNSPSGDLQGIVGFSPGGAAVAGTNGYFDQFVATTHAPNIFATMLCDSGGTLWLGGYDSTYTTDAPQYTPHIAGALQFVYGVNLASVTVDGTSASIANATYPLSIVDTGTSIFTLPTQAFNTVTQAIAGDAQFQAIIGEPASWLSSPTDPNQCKTLSQSKADLDAALPPMTLTFGSDASAISVQALATESYLVNYQAGSQSVWCPTLYAIDPSDQNPIVSIIGAPVLRSNVVIFDREQQRIGFAPHVACK